MEFCENCKKIIDARIKQLVEFEIDNLQQDATRNAIVTQLEYLWDVFCKSVKE